MNKVTEKIFEWSATLISIIGVSLNAFNVFPLNIYILFVANVLWILVAYNWKKWSLLTIQVVLSILYIAGFVKLWS